MLKLKDPKPREIVRSDGTKLTVEAEVHDEFLIHGYINRGYLSQSYHSDRYYQVTHTRTHQLCVKCKNVTTARKAIKLLRSSGVDWSAGTVEALQADPEKFRAAFLLIKPLWFDSNYPSA